jgi:hypothetical protein
MELVMAYARNERMEENCEMELVTS